MHIRSFPLRYSARNAIVTFGKLAVEVHDMGIGLEGLVMYEVVALRSANIGISALRSGSITDSRRRLQRIVPNKWWRKVAVG